MSPMSGETVFTAISADGTPIGCVVDGEGPPLLMVHGTGDTHLGWRRARQLLSPRFKLYLMDRRGRGVSGDNAAYALEREWDDVAAVLDAIGEPVNLFAHSFGGMCALEGALRARRESLRRIAIYEPSVNRNLGNPARDRTIDEMGRLIAAGDRDAVVTVHLSRIINLPDEAIAKQRALTEGWAMRLGMAHTMPRELLALRGYEFDAARFSPLRAPLRVLVGEKSAAHSQATARALSQAVSGSELVVLAGQGHFAMLTAPALFAENLIDFFAEAP
jgi:pimeloyl-ACP methyl ester carboxylesterase